jgi:5-methylcytosine-specific restriction protein A
MWHAVRAFFRLFTHEHHTRVAMSLQREAKKAEERSPHWRTVEKHFREKNPRCAACGGKAHLQVHHCEPFHSHPELELEPTNLIGLCMGRHECHIRIGHGDDFHFYNPDVRKDAATVLANPKVREHVEAVAKEKRLVNQPGGA